MENKGQKDSKKVLEVMRLEKINKTYTIKINKINKTINVLSNINIKFYSNNFYAIMGHSGSGKSTLINILGLIDKFDSGEYYLYDTKAIEYDDEAISNLRMKNIGFIFQEINLDYDLKAFENVMVPMLINKEINSKERKKRAIELLDSVGLSERIYHFPRELSGGEQQRVAIARALANNPSIILADEPTGNLDKLNEKNVFNILKELSKKGKCVIVVSHSDIIKKYADKVYKIINRELVGENK